MSLRSARHRTVVLPAVVGLAAVLCTCDCSASHQAAPPDAGTDAGGDAGRRRDGGHDGGSDAGPRVGFPEGWEPVPRLPDWCDAWRPLGSAASVIEPLRFEPCSPPEAGCEQLVIDWERSRIHNNYFIANRPQQTADADVIVLAKAVVVEDAAHEWLDWAVYRVTGEPLAVFRTTVSPPEEIHRVWCALSAVDATVDEIAVSFAALSDRYEESRDDEDFAVVLLVDEAEGIQHSANVVFDLEVVDLLSQGNVPNQLLYDGENLIVRGNLGGVYLGSLAGGPWREIATGRTDDASNSGGVLFDGTFYWNSTTLDGRSWGRIRRRMPGSEVNETFMARPDGALNDFRTDGSWAAWAHHADDDPPDGRPDRTDIYAVRIDGAFDPPSWSPTRLTSVPIPNRVNSSSRPVFVNGLYAYLASDRLFEMVDVVNHRRLRIPTAGLQWWRTLLHLGDDYLFLVHNGTRGIDGLRRYTLAELEGWEPL